jgi:hypothetical protein
MDISNEKIYNFLVYAGGRSGSSTPGRSLLASLLDRFSSISVRESSTVGGKGKKNPTMRPNFEARLGRYDGDTDHAEFDMSG